MTSFKGLLNSILRRRERSVSETLEDIDSNIALLREHKSQNVSKANKIAFQIIFYASIPYATIVVICYFIIRPERPQWKALFTAFVISYPLLVWLLRCIVRVLYLGSANRAENKLKDLTKQKRQILENVMNTETYNKAQQLLKRFDPMGLIVRDEFSSPDRAKNRIETETCAKPRQSVQGSIKSTTPVTQTTQARNSVNVPRQQPTMATQTPNGPITHRPILPRDRSLLDRFMDAIVGDGPDRRYALVCRQCAGHNGMALAEEFEFLAFRCCYCGFHNAARRSRRPPASPALGFPSGSDTPSAQQTPMPGSRRLQAAASTLSLVSPLNSPPPTSRGFGRVISASTENVYSSSSFAGAFVESDGPAPRSPQQRSNKNKQQQKQRTPSISSLVEEEEEEKKREN